MPPDSLEKTALQGAIAGLLATVPMTLVMVKWHQKLPLTQRYFLPPRLITDQLAAKMPNAGRFIGPPARRAHAAHFAFGAAAGAAYSLIAPRRASATAGVGYGLLVWAASYLGWVPLADLMAPATRQPAARNAMMIAAHIVWGAALAISLDVLQSRGRERRPPEYL